jgi:hypothetical protein
LSEVLADFPSVRLCLASTAKTPTTASAAIVIPDTQTVDFNLRPSHLAGADQGGNATWRQ